MSCPDGFLAERMTFYAALYPHLREVARQHGYALALHGSLQKDLDVLAVPWVETPSDVEVLVGAIVKRADGMLQGLGTSQFYLDRPHGRRTFTILLGGEGGYVDLSVVMPRVAVPGSV